MKILEKFLGKFGYIKVTDKTSGDIEVTDIEYIIKFKDKTDALRAIYSSNMYYTLWEIRMNYRKKLEWFVETNPDINKYELIDEIFNMFNIELETNELTSLIDT